MANANGLQVPYAVTDDGAGDFARLLTEIRECKLCAAHLPLPPRPVVQLGQGARLLIVGQAPGTRAHAAGRPFDDVSGDTLRRWLGLDRTAFYDPERLALAPAGFCYPGRSRGGDAPPRPECAPLWQARVRAALPRLETILLVGAYAQAWYLRDQISARLAETCQRWRVFAPALWPIPHPSPRNRRWLRLNPWFEAEVVPALQAHVATLLHESVSRDQAAPI